MFSAHSDRHRNPPWGLKGGKSGGCGKFRILQDGEKKSSLQSKVSDIRIEANEILSARTAGGGGWGPPEKRDRDHVRLDVITGKISRKQAEDVYKKKLETGEKS